MAKKRDYWREKQRERRLNMSEDKKEEVRLKSRQRYREKVGKVKTTQDLAVQVVQTDLSQVVQTDLSQVVQTDLSQVVQTLSSATEANLCASTEANLCASTEANMYAPPPEWSPSASPETTEVNASPSKAAKYSALQRVKKAWPNNPKSSLYVLQQLVKVASPGKRKILCDVLGLNLDKETTPQPQTKGKRKRRVPDRVVTQEVIQFYKNNSVSMPGQRQFSKRMNKQKKVLTEPIASLYDQFRKANPNLKIGIRNFFKLRPKHIVTMQNQKFIQCLCEVCENASLKLKSLKSCGAKFATVTDALDATMCDKTGDWWRPQCVARKCKHCGIHLLKEKLLSQCGTRTSITYRQWKLQFSAKFQCNRTDLIHHKCSVNHLINLFISELKTLALHSFTAKWQRKQFQDLKTNIPPDTAVVVVDFAENYTCKHQREVSSLHWGYAQVTVHPVVIHHNCSVCIQKITSWRVFVSDDLKHDSSFAFHVLRHVMKEFNLSKYIIFSDNCGVQYKSKLPFHHMSRLASDFNFERCYFGERHGKSECDSCGGTVKSFLTRSVVSGQVILRNAREIVSFLNSKMAVQNTNCSHRTRSFFFIGDKDVDRRVKSAQLKTLPGTKKIHSLKVLSGQILAVRQFSCFCSNCLSSRPDQCLQRCVISDFNLIKWANAKSDNVVVLPVQESEGVDFNTSSVVCCDDDVPPVQESEGVDFNTSSVVCCDDDVLAVQESEGVDFNTSSVVCCDDDVPPVQESEGVYLNLSCDDEDDPLNTAVCEPQYELGSDDLVVDGSCNGVHDALAKGGHDDVRFTSDVCQHDGAVYHSNTEMTLPASDVVKVKKNLFETVKGRDEFFRSVYQDFLACSCFEELKVACKKVHPQFVKYDLIIEHPTMSRRNVDKTALQLLPPNKPSGFLPVLTVGDGNCMTRSLSKVVFGHENRHLEMRCRIITELTLNKSIYLDEDFVSVGCTLEKSEILPLVALLSDVHDGRDTKSSSAIEDIFEKETFGARQLCRCLGIWQLLAASNLLKCAIMSLYPQKGPKNVQALFARAMLPQGMDCDYDNIVYVMWSSTRDMPDEHWVANHVVPMLKFHK